MGRARETSATIAPPAMRAFVGIGSGPGGNGGTAQRSTAAARRQEVAQTVANERTRMRE